MTITRKIRKLEGVIKEKEPRWIRIKTYNNGTIVDATCSSCKYTWEYMSGEHSFCPNCGKKMKKNKILEDALSWASGARHEV